MQPGSPIDQEKRSQRCATDIVVGGDDRAGGARRQRDVVQVDHHARGAVSRKGSGRHGADAKIQRKRVRFFLPQSPKVLTAAAQVRGLQVVTGVASFHYEGPGDRTFAIDQSVIEWADDVKELRVTIETASQGPGSTISRVSYNAFILAKVG